MAVLELGCGMKKTPGTVCVDYYNPQLADFKWDLNQFPYPFKDNEFEGVISSHVIEHLNDCLKVMEELHRITKPGGIIKIRVPHFSSCNALSHLTHKRAFGAGTFAPLVISDSWERYGTVRFKLLKIQLYWIRMRDLNSKDGKLHKFYWLARPIDKLIVYLANKNIFLTERVWCYLVGGFDEIYYELEVVK